MRTVEWLNSNAYRRYPLQEGPVPRIGGVDLPDDFLLDFRLVDTTSGIAWSTATRAVSLYSVVFLAGTATVTFRNGAGAEYTITVPTTAAVPYSTVVGHDLASRRYTVACSFGAGVATLYEAGAGGTVSGDAFVEPTLVETLGAHTLDSVQGDFSGSTRLSSGTIYFKQGSGVSVRIDPELNRVRLSAFPGAGDGFDCGAGSGVKCNDAILYLNDVSPDGRGKILLGVGRGMDIENLPASNTIVLHSQIAADNASCGADEGGTLNA